MPAAASIQPDPNEDAMTPRMITMMVMAHPAVCDHELAEAARNAIDEEVYLDLDGSSLIVDCKTLTPREDEFFRTRSEWKAKG